MTIANSPLAVAISSCFIAATTTALIVPSVKIFCLRLRLIDPPDSRKQHSSPMVRLGGITLLLGFSFALTVIWVLGGFDFIPPDKDQLIWSTLAGALCFFVIGFADDLFALSPWSRLTSQVCLALLLFSIGVVMGFDIRFKIGPSDENTKN